MAIRLETNVEPIPGYKLIERLGGGGFGEVWKAEAPGGLHKAIKFVYGDLEALDAPDGARAEQELKALSRVKSVHHPYILSLERFDIIDGQLLIVMELADRTLWDRFKECRTQGSPGIPRDELLNYMRETAEALDLMNSLYQLQHLDIKPQNLFLVYNHVKVADFGLVKDLGGRNEATITGGSTPVYAAPETFDGWLSRFTDQYSLAIVYQELLTGQRPFTGSTIRQLVMQHLQGEPDLSSLPIGDRPSVARALAKKPEQRFPTCQDFINCLRAASAPALPPLLSAEDSALLGETPVEQPSLASSRSLGTVAMRGNKAKAPEAPEVPFAPLDRPQVLPPRRKEEPVAPPSLCASGHASVFPTARVKRPAAAAATSGGILQPALVIGLGQLGIQTLRRLRHHLVREFGAAEALPQLRLLGLDVDADTIGAATQGEQDSALRQSELVLAKLHRASHYLKPREGKVAHQSWLNSKLLYRLGKQAGAGSRALGRLAVVDNVRGLSRRLEMELQACCAQDTPHDGTLRADLGLRSSTPRVILITALAGQTGSGMVIDLAYMARALLRRQGIDSAEITGLFYAPRVGNTSFGALDLAQAHAALKELAHFSAANATFVADYDHFGTCDRFSEQGSPLQRCLFLQLPPRTSVAPPEQLPEEALALAGQYLYRELATPLGKTAEEVRAAAARPRRSVDTRLGSFGLYCYQWPRRDLLDLAGKRLCRQLVDRWMAKSAAGLTDAVAQWAEQTWEAEGLRPEQLIARHQEGCAKLVAQNPEEMIAGVLRPLTGLLTAPAKAGGEALKLGPVVQVVAELGKLLGQIEDSAQAGSIASPEPGSLESALAQTAAAITEECDQRLTEAVVKLIEDPRYRLAGAEEALRQFNALIERFLQSQEPLTRELQERAAALSQRVHALLEGPPSQQTPHTSGGKVTLGLKSRLPATFGADLFELIKCYAKSRFQSLILSHIQRLLVSVRGHLSDQLLEVGYCRQRLGELSGWFEDRTPAPGIGNRARTKAEQFLLPEGCRDLEQAVDELTAKVSAEDLFHLDVHIQKKIIRQHFQALLKVCLGPSVGVRNLAPMMLHEALVFLEPRLEGASVGEMFIRQKTVAGDDLEGAGAELSAALGEANSDLVQAPASEIAVAALPDDTHGQLLRQYLRLKMPHVHTSVVPRADEIVLLREQYFDAWSDLQLMGPAAEAIYQQRLHADPFALHSRCDIPALTGGEQALATT